MNEVDVPVRPNASAEFLAGLIPQIHDAVRFAEAKNAMMVTLTSAGVFGSVTLLCQANLPRPMDLALLACLPLLLSAGTLALLSFLPRLEGISGGRKRPTAPSLCFFGAIARFEPEYYLQLVAERFQEKTAERDPLCRDYAAQAVINSRIAMRKLLLFRLSVVICLVCLYAFAIAFLFGRLGY